MPAVAATDATAAEATITAALRELLDTFARMDAVERGMQFFNPNHSPVNGQFTTGGAGGAGGAGKGGTGAKGSARKAGGAVAKSSKGSASSKVRAAKSAAKSGGTAAPAAATPKPSKVELEERAKQRVADAQKKLAASQKALKAAETRRDQFLLQDTGEIGRLRSAYHDAEMAHYSSWTAAKESIEEERAAAKVASGKAPKTAEKFASARQPYEDAKAAHAQAKAVSDASRAQYEHLLNQYRGNRDLTRPGEFDRMLRDHPDFKAAMRQSQKDESVAYKAQLALWRKQGTYEGARAQLAGKISDADVSAHPLRMAAQARLDEARAQLEAKTGDDQVRVAFAAKSRAQSELNEAKAELENPTWRYTLTGERPTTAATYSSLDHWPQDKLDAALALEVPNNKMDVHVGDLALHELQRAQGFNEKPDIVTEAELRAGIKNGDIEMWRGDTKISHTDDMMTGDYHTGMGIRGNGTYAQEGAAGHSVARSYATNRGQSQDNGRIMHMSLKRDARIVDYNKLLSEKRQAESDAQRALHDAQSRGDTAGARRAEASLRLAGGDSSRFAAAHGYDAVRIPAHGQMIVLNRTAVRISHQIRPGDYQG